MHIKNMCVWHAQPKHRCICTAAESFLCLWRLQSCWPALEAAAVCHAGAGMQAISSNSSNRLDTLCLVGMMVAAQLLRLLAHTLAGRTGWLACMDSPLGVPGELERAAPGQALHEGMMFLYLESRIRPNSFISHWQAAWRLSGPDVAVLEQVTFKRCVHSCSMCGRVFASRV
jgi:hypothetical protein